MKCRTQFVIQTAEVNLFAFNITSTSPKIYPA